MALSTQAQKELIAVARGVLDALAKGEQEQNVQQDYSEELRQHCGAFVTLHCDGQLRGCIGMITSDDPLAVTVTDMALAAATRDPRFSAVTPEEAGRCDIEISVMTPPRVLENPETVEVGKHGLIVSRGYHRGLLLPQVATEQQWDRETFLEHTCLKAGLPHDAWKDTDTIIETFEAEIIEEGECAG